MPGRQIVLVARTLDRAGVQVGRADRSYQRMLSDEKGAEAPFFAATRLASDNRIAPKETRTETFDLEAPLSGELRVEVFWRALSPALAVSLGVGQPQQVPMLAARIPFGAGRAGKKRALPSKPVIVGPGTAL